MATADSKCRDESMSQEYVSHDGKQGLDVVEVGWMERIEIWNG